MLLKSFTLLFVEDDPQTQELMKALLEEDVKIFYQAYNGKEGLAIYREKKPDIIITDINMPILSGMEMADKIKEIDKTQSILMMSALDNRETLLNAINIGIDGFVVKPVDMEQLNSKLSEVAQNLQNRIDAENSRLKVMKEKQKEEMQGLYNLAHYDVLTNIPNRHLFNEKLDLAIVNSEQNNMALFFIDLDNFKIVNDSYGHKAGDYTLVTIVNNIKKVIRNTDTFARIGGDEFALLVEDVIGRESLEKLAEKIIEAVSVPFYFDEQKINISCSIGISQYKQDADSKEELIHFADLAMYNTKSTGKSNFSFYKP